jgi:hypothetical protein
MSDDGADARRVAPLDQSFDAAIAWIRDSIRILEGVHRASGFQSASEAEALRHKKALVAGIEALRAAASSGVSPAHIDPDCEVARGVGWMCTCETAEEKAEQARHVAECEAERDAQSSADIQGGAVPASTEPRHAAKMREVFSLPKIEKSLRVKAAACRSLAAAAQDGSMNQRNWAGLADELVSAADAVALHAAAVPLPAARPEAREMTTSEEPSHE